MKSNKANTGMEMAITGKEQMWLPMSAKTPDSLLEYVKKLKISLENDSMINLYNVVHTLQTGCQNFEYRASTNFKDRGELLAFLNEIDLETISQNIDAKEKKLVLIFPGRGCQYINMGLQLYQKQPAFKDKMDEGFAYVKRSTGQDMKDILFSESNFQDGLNEFLYLDALIFLVQCSLAQLVKTSNIPIDSTIGYGVGEYTSACISGLLGFEEGLELLLRRGELLATVPESEMLLVAMTEEEAKMFSNCGISLTAINGSQEVILSGNTVNIDDLVKHLKETDVAHAKLERKNYEHLNVPDKVLKRYDELLKNVKWGEIEIPFFSGLTGELIQKKDDCPADYWISKMNSPTNFYKCIKNLLKTDQEIVFLEAGYARNLTSSLIKELKSLNSGIPVLNLIKSEDDTLGDIEFFKNTLKVLWSYGFDCSEDLIDSRYSLKY